jgi:hypothetical protein
MDVSEPLLGFIIGRAIVENHDVPPHIRQCLYRCVRNYLSDSITFDECLTTAHSAVPSTDFLTELRAILATEPAPPTVQPHGRVRWTEDEDRRLLAAFHRYGPRNWPTIAVFVGNGRTKPQCAQRWRRSLDPAIRRDKWLPKEDASLTLAVQRHGERAWMKVSNDVKTRCDVQCRGRWNTIKAHREHPSPVHFQENDDHGDLSLLDFEICNAVELFWDDDPQPPGTGQSQNEN